MALNVHTPEEDPRIAQLENELEQKEQILHKAGELGKNLLQQNAELQEELEAKDREFLQKMEAEAQEIYALQKSVDQKTNMERIYLEEIESLKTSLESFRRQNDFANEAEQSFKLCEMKKKNKDLQMEVDRLTLAESQLINEAEALRQQLAALKNELANQTTQNDETCSEDMARLLSDLQSQRDEKEELKKSLHELNNEYQLLRLTERHLNLEISSSKEEVVEKECQISSYQNALEKCREECQDLQVQLDVQRMESMDKANKGNSLFSEVEDRRIRAEIELSKLRVEFDSMRKKHILVAQQMHRYQSQMLIFMQSASSQIDESRLKKLERDAYVARQQIEQLTRENSELKREKDNNTDLRGLLSTAETLTKSEMNDFMLVRLENKSKELEATQKELSSEKFKRLSYETSLMKKESELYELKKRLKMTEAANAKVKLKMEKLKLKYEPESLDVGDKIERRHVETIPLFAMADEHHEQQSEAEQRNAGSSALNIDKNSGAINLVDLLSKPRSLKRVRISDDIVTMESEIPSTTAGAKEGNNNEIEIDENETTAEVREKSKRQSKGREKYRRTVKVTGENSEQCKQQ